MVADLAMVLLAAVAATALGLAEAVPILHLPRGAAWSLLLRRTPARALALALLGIGLRRVVEAMSLALAGDLAAMLLRHGPGGPATLLGPALGLVWLGLALAVATLPAVTVATLCGVVGVAAASTWLATTWLLPVRAGRAGALLLSTLLVAGPCLVLAGRSWRRELRRYRRGSPELRGLQRQGRGLRRAALVLAAGALLLLRDSWPSAWLPGALAFVLAAAGGVYLFTVAADGMLADAPTGRLAWTATRQLAEFRPGVWLLVGGLACLLHWTVLMAALPAAAVNGRRTLRVVAAWPQLLCRQPDPSPAQWAPVAARIAAAVTQHPGHPWCGQWLLVQAWIESTRLNHLYTATLLLRQARAQYGQAPAEAPPGWHRGRTVGSIAKQMLADWGRLVEPGSNPG